MDESLERVFELIDHYWKGTDKIPDLSALESLDPGYDSHEISSSSDECVEIETIDRIKPRKAEKPGNDTEEYDHTKFVSMAPLHRRCINTTSITKEDLQKLIEEGYSVDRSEWCSYEYKRLQENWDRIKKYHPKYADPKFAFGGGHNNGGKLTPLQIRRTQKKYKRFDMMLRMAYKLDDRLICDIYFRCRQMFYDKSFYFTSREFLPSHVEDAIKKDLKAGMSQYEITFKHDVSPTLVKIINRRKEPKTRRFNWTAQASARLKEVVGDRHADIELEEVQARDVDWVEVAREMRTFGYEVDGDNCRYNWVKTFPKSVATRRKRNGQYVD